MEKSFGCCILKHLNSNLRFCREDAATLNSESQNGVYGACKPGWESQPLPVRTFASATFIQNGRVRSACHFNPLYLGGACHFNPLYWGTARHVNPLYFRVKKRRHFRATKRRLINGRLNDGIFRDA